MHSGQSGSDPSHPDSYNANYSFSVAQDAVDIDGSLQATRPATEDGGLVSLSNVWVQTLSDGLVRADQVTGIDAHQTPALTGKPSRWLLDVVLPVSIGSGHREGWGVTVLHRTLIQTSADPGNAAAALARLLAQLDLISAAGIITTSRGDQQPTGRPATAPDEEELVAEASQVRLRFVPFPPPRPGHNTGPEYL
jgi:hypothetical protein